MSKADQMIKMPPQNQEAEISLLGCLLIDKTAIVKVIDIIQPNDFYNDINGWGEYGQALVTGWTSQCTWNAHYNVVFYTDRNSLIL